MDNRVRHNYPPPSSLTSEGDPAISDLSSDSSAASYRSCGDVSNYNPATVFNNPEDQPQFWTASDSSDSIVAPIVRCKHGIRTERQSRYNERDVFHNIEYRKQKLRELEAKRAAQLGLTQEDVNNNQSGQLSQENVRRECQAIYASIYSNDAESQGDFHQVTTATHIRLNQQPKKDQPKKEKKRFGIGKPSVSKVNKLISDAKDTLVHVYARPASIIPYAGNDEDDQSYSQLTPSGRDFNYPPPLPQPPADFGAKGGNRPRPNSLAAPRSSNVDFSRSPNKEFARSPNQKFSRSPNQDFSRSPNQDFSRSPNQDFSRSPNQDFSRSPHQEFARSPNQEFVHPIDQDLLFSDDHQELAPSSPNVEVTKPIEEDLFFSTSQEPSSPPNRSENVSSSSSHQDLFASPSQELFTTLSQDPFTLTTQDPFSLPGGQDPFSISGGQDPFVVPSSAESLLLPSHQEIFSTSPGHHQDPFDTSHHGVDPFALSSKTHHGSADPFTSTNPNNPFASSSSSSSNHQNPFNLSNQLEDFSRSPNRIYSRSPPKQNFSRPLSSTSSTSSSNQNLSRSPNPNFLSSDWPGTGAMSRGFSELHLQVKPQFDHKHRPLMTSQPCLAMNALGAERKPSIGHEKHPRERNPPPSHHHPPHPTHPNGPIHDRGHHSVTKCPSFTNGGVGDNLRRSRSFIDKVQVLGRSAKNAIQRAFSQERIYRPEQEERREHRGVGHHKKNKRNHLEVRDNRRRPSEDVRDPSELRNSIGGVLWGEARPSYIDQVWGQLIQLNIDGSQVVELSRPKRSPFGFFLARGRLRDNKGVFVSRMIDHAIEKTLSGLLEVGDEILEIDGVWVKDFEIMDVNAMMACKTSLLVTVLPYGSRKDI